MMTLETRAFARLQALAVHSIEDTLESHAAYINGFTSSAMALGVSDSAPGRIWSTQFADFVCERFNVSVPSTVNAISVVGMIYGSGPTSFEKLMSLWQDFLLGSGCSALGLEKHPPAAPGMDERQLLDAMQRRCGLYIGLPAITRFVAYYRGAADAQEEFGTRWVGELLDAKFETWVSKELEIAGYSPWWRKLILLEGGNEFSALQRAFLLMDDYFATKE